jgi:hypothetical protein
MINQAALERIKRLLNIHSYKLDLDDRFRDRLGYYEATHMMVSYLLYGKNIVIENPNPDVAKFIETLIVKAPAFMKLHKSIRHELQASFYIKSLLDELVAIMPGFIKFNAQERNELVEYAKKMQLAIKHGDPVSEKKMIEITNRIQLLNNAEKNGGIVVAHNPGVIDSMRAFNVECIKILHNWVVGYGRLFSTIGIPDNIVKKDSATYAEEINDMINILESSENINKFLKPFDELPNYSGKIVLIIDRRRNTSDDFGEDDAMKKIALLPFYLKSHGVDLITVYIPVKENVLETSEIDINIENISHVMKACTEDAYYFRYNHDSNIALKAVEIMTNPEYDGEYNKHDDVKVIILSYYCKCDIKSPFYSDECGKIISEIPNSYQYRLNLDDIDNDIRRIITNEAKF